MVVTMLWILVFFVAVVANVGQAVNRRIALQMVADAGAYTGGAVMATGWNHLAYWNRHIQRMASWIAISSDGYTVNICGCNPFIPFACDEITIPLYAGAHAAFQATNFKFGSLLNSEPRRVSDFNIRDLFPGEDPNSFEFSHSDMSGDARITNFPPVGDMGVAAIPFPSDADAETGKPLWDDETFYDWIPDPFVSTSSDISPRSWTSVCFPESWDMTVPVFWWKLLRTGPAYHYIYEVKSPPTRAIMFDSIIGPNAIPQMKAVAVTKPVGDRNRRGEIERGDIGYLVKLVKASNVIVGGFINDPFYKGSGGQKQVMH
jgi:hypothetical protein